MADVPGSPGLRAFSALLTATSLALLLAFSSPANAQDSSASPSPGASQYDVVVDGADVGAIPPAISDNVTGGADAVNQAMTKDDKAPATKASPSTGESLSTEASPSAGGAQKELAALPETGGAPLPALCGVVALLIYALLLSRPKANS